MAAATTKPHERGMNSFFDDCHDASSEILLRSDDREDSERLMSAQRRMVNMQITITDMFCKTFPLAFRIKALAKLRDLSCLAGSPEGSRYKA